MDRDERLQALMGEDGITNCGNAPELRESMSDEYPTHQSHLRRKPRDRAVMVCLVG
jgi:hypothetical protein